jgi:AcrR family transcriptional regulator
MKFQTIQNLIYVAEREGLVQRTFRRLDPDKQQVVIQAILAEASEVGPDAVRIHFVAKKAGVAVGSLYQYFLDREKLLEFAVRLCTRAMIDLFETYTPILSAMPLREGLKAYLLGGIEMSQTDREMVLFFGRAAYQGAEGSLKSSVDTVALQLLRMVREMLSQAQLRGELMPEVDIEVAARTVNLLLIALGDSQLFPYLNTYYRISPEEIAFERVLEQAIEMILNGIGVQKQGVINGPLQS